MEIQAINKQVVNLMHKISIEEGAINHYVKHQITTALDVCSRHIQTKHFRRNFPQECRIIENNINVVEDMLLNLPTQKNTYEITPKSNNELDHMQMNLNDFEQRIARNGIEATNYQNILDIATYQAQHLDLHRRLNHRQRINISLMFLKLYINTPPVNIATMLSSSIIPHLNQASRDVANLNVHKINPSEAEIVKTYLKNVISILEHTKTNCTEALEEIEQKLSSRDPNEIVNELTEELDHYCNKISALDIPVEEDVVETLKHKLSHIVEVQFLQIPQDDNFQVKKTELQEKAKLILEDLKNVNAKFIFLTETEEEISKIVDSNRNSEEKIRQLEYWKKVLQQTDTINKTFLLKRNDILKKISAYVMAEEAIYFRQKLIVVEDYKNYALKFAFPKHVEMYNIKRSEIIALKNCFDNLPKDSDFFKDRIQVFMDRVERVITTLEERANSNGEIISKLEALQTISEEISSWEGSLDVNLEVFNTCRSKIQAIDRCDSRIIKKKIEVLKCLHKIEKNFYKHHCPQVEGIVSRLLDMYVECTQTLIRTNCENFSTRREKLVNYQTDSNNYFRTDGSENTQNLSKMFDTLFIQLNHMMQHNEELNAWMKDVKEVEEEVSNVPSQSSDDEQMQFLQNYQQKINVLKSQTTGDNQMNRLLKIETFILQEKARIFLNKVLNEEIKQLEEDINTRLSQNDIMQFLDKVNKIFTLKELIHDVPDEFTELQNLKNSALEKLYYVLRLVDKQLAEFALKKIQFDNVINVESYFHNLRVDDVSNKESVEFVREVRALADTFKDRIKYFLGTNDSLDYYIIHESLIRLLEELDAMKCDDDALLEETVKTMQHIKNLKMQLLAKSTLSE